MAIQIRRGTDSDWESGKSNIVVGEPAITTDTKRFFVGTGTGTYAEFANQTQVSSLDTDINATTTGLKDRMTAVETDIAGLGDASELDYDVLGTGSSIVLADYIVAQGTTTVSGITWTYRKWDSGIAECWATVNLTVTAWSAWGQIVHSDESLSATYPTGLFSTVTYLNASADGTPDSTPYATVGVELGGGSSTTFPTIRILRPTAAGTGSHIFAVHLEVRGTWQ